jgi:hypothetical protein
VANVRWVAPGELRLPTSRSTVDLIKLAEQYRRFGTSVTGMPPIEVTLCGGGLMVINDGVTRATRAHRYGSGVLVPVVVIEELLAVDARKLPRVADR